MKINVPLLGITKVDDTYVVRTYKHRGEVKHFFETTFLEMATIKSNKGALVVAGNKISTIYIGSENTFFDNCFSGCDRIYITFEDARLRKIVFDELSDVTKNGKYLRIGRYWSLKSERYALRTTLPYTIIIEGEVYQENIKEFLDL
tara:strand:+ start:2912 stop:3349 length:438 start_codon:yes stop_codon:yes gene_type:complete